MKRGTMLALVLAALCALPAVARDQTEFELEYRRFRRSVPAGFGRTQQFLGAMPGAPFRVKAPKLSGDAVYFTHEFAGREVVLLVDSGKKPKLYVDVDGDKDLAEEEPLQGKREGAEGQYAFGVVTIPGGRPGGDIEFRARTWGSQGSIGYLFVEPAGIRTGAADIGGTTYRLRILDANLDGRYDGVFDPAGSHSPDYYVLVESGRGARSRAGEGRPLPRILELGEQWYSFEVRPNGAAAALAPIEPEFGTLSIGTDAAEIRLLSDTGTYHLKGDGGNWELPAGNYTAQQIVLDAQDGEDTWQISAYGDTGKLRQFTIRPDERVDVTVGPPLKLTTEVSAAGPSQVYISLALTGRADENYSPGARKNGRRVQAPTYKIFDEAGELLSSGRFEYG